MRLRVWKAYCLSLLLPLLLPRFLGFDFDLLVGCRLSRLDALPLLLLLELSRELDLADLKDTCDFLELWEPALSERWLPLLDCRDLLDLRDP